MIVIVLLLVFVILFVWLSVSPKAPLLKEIEELDSLYRNGSIPTVSEEELASKQNDIIAVAHRENTIEKYTPKSNPVDRKYWPQYYYSYPASWPPDMFTRLTYWTPGFSTSGWNYQVRPGVYYQKWPRSRWVTDNNNYYFINNSKGLRDP